LNRVGKATQDNEDVDDDDNDDERNRVQRNTDRTNIVDCMKKTLLATRRARSFFICFVHNLIDPTAVVAGGEIERNRKRFVVQRVAVGGARHVQKAIRPATILLNHAIVKDLCQIHA
jgi:hypothetical protein